MLAFPICDDFIIGSLEAITAYLPCIFFVRWYSLREVSPWYIVFCCFRCNAGKVIISREYLFLLCLQERKNMFVIADVLIGLFYY